MNKKLFIWLLALSVCVITKAQTDSQIQVSSLIVALDVRSNVNKVWNTDKVTAELDSLLINSQVSPTYVSGVLYGIKKEASTPEGFSRLIHKPQSSGAGYYAVLERLHSRLPAGLYYSITSFAKPYSFMALKNCQETNRTYMAILTDGKYNGNDDYYGEISYVKHHFTDQGRDQFKADIRDVQTNYFCQFIDERHIDGGYIQLYEFIPLQQYFALESVLAFPQEVIAKRSKEGYDLHVPIQIIGNKDYEIKKIEVCLKVNDQEKKTYDLTQGEDLNISVSKEEISNAIFEIHAWLKLNDGIYNNTILHPYGSNLQGAKGLIRQISVGKESDAQILGICSLPDFLFSISFWTSDQAVAAASWGWIFFILTIIIILIFVAKSNVYKVDPKHIKI